MTPISIIAVIVAITANVASNILFKAAMQRASGEGFLQVALSVARTWQIWLGLTLAGVLVVSYLIAIRNLPLGPTYAQVTGMTIALLTLWGYVMGGQSLDVIKLLGTALIIAGFLLVVIPFKS